jgi:hypothetical protein
VDELLEESTGTEDELLGRTELLDELLLHIPGSDAQ